MLSGVHHFFLLLVSRPTRLSVEREEVSRSAREEGYGTDQGFHGGGAEGHVGSSAEENLFGGGGAMRVKLDCHCHCPQAQGVGGPGGR